MVDKLDFIKLKNLNASKDTIWGVKRWPTEWEKRIFKSWSDKGLRKRTATTQQQKNKQPNSKMGKGFKQTFPQRSTNGQ